MYVVVSVSKTSKLGSIDTKSPFESNHSNSTILSPVGVKRQASSSVDQLPVLFLSGGTYAMDPSLFCIPTIFPLSKELQYGALSI